MESLFRAFFNEYITNCDKIPAYIQEEYMTDAGVFDIPYISAKFKEPLSKKSGNEIINSIFGRVYFEPIKYTSEVTLEEFQKEYKFGKFINVRGWISYMYHATGKLLTRKDLYKYLMVTK